MSSTPRLSLVQSHVRLMMACLLVATLATSGWCQQDTRDYRPDVARTTGGVVASDSPAASLVGRDVMVQGGNAVDAAVATAFAMSVTWPEAGNIGGGGFMMIAPAQGDVVCVDYRETSPLSTDENSFLKQTDRRDSRMVGVPGTVRGLALAHEKFGTLPWKDLILPSVRLARDGFVVDEALAGSLNYAVELAKTTKSPLHRELIRVYGRTDQRRWVAGDVLQLPDLADTLERIATDGPDEFYTGQTAKMLVKFMESSDGFIRSEDLKQYAAVQRPAIQSEFMGYQVFGAPLPSSGGTTIAMALNTLESLGFGPEANDPYPWSAKQLHQVGETMRRTFRERAEHLGDADFVAVPKHLTSKDFADQLAATISDKRATRSVDIAGNIPLTEGAYESPDTTHFSVIDEAGMAVSNTYTLEAAWGSMVIAPGTGAVLNNEMGDFNWYPGYTNLAGRIGTTPNQIAPGKRMLSSMSPTIVKRDGRVCLVTGTPGGRTIINSTLGILLQKLALGRSLEDAVRANRFHHQWLPDELRLESQAVTGVDEDTWSGTVDSLRGKGHNVAVRGPQGSVHSIEVDLGTGVRTGVSDFRRGGRVHVTR